MNKNKQHLQTKVSPVWAVLFLCGLNLLFMHFYIFLTCHLDAELDSAFFFDNFIGVCFDILIVFFISYCLSLRIIKEALSICFFVTWIWSLSSVMYSRFFFHYLSLSTVCQGMALGDELIIQCVKANLRVIDLYYPSVAVLFVILLKKSQFDSSLLIWKRIVIGFFFILLCDIGIHAVYCMSNPKLRYISYYPHRLYSNHFVGHLNYSAPILAHFLRGEVRTLFEEIRMNLFDKVYLSEKQMSEINNWVARGGIRIG